MMKTTRKRRTTKASRRSSKTSAAHFLQDNAGTALRRGRDTINRAYDWAHETAGSAHLGNLRMPRRSDITHLAEANPLLLGAVGLGLGVAIATLFPRGMGMGRPASRRATNGSATPVKTTGRRRRKTRKAVKARANTAATG
ncbi:MAG: hypothetical protein AB7F09_15745 [Parvibaculaceae bacterium]